jgi:hypothetical protein
MTLLQTVVPLYFCSSLISRVTPEGMPFGKGFHSFPDHASAQAFAQSGNQPLTD